MNENTHLEEQKTRLQMISIFLGLLVAGLAGYIFVTHKAEVPPPPAAEQKAGDAKKAAPGFVHLDALGQREANLALMVVASKIEKDTIKANGQITTNENESWHVGVHAEGKITQVKVNIGDHVSKGQVLALMHSHIVHETRAAYAQAQAELDRSNTHAEQARRVSERARRLLKAEAISQEQAEHAASDLRTAQTDIVKARATLDKEQQHMTEFLEIAVTDKRTNNGEDPDAVPIKAPNAGVITRRLISSGSVVSAGQEAFTISNLNSLWVIAAVNETDLAAVRPGMRARVTVRAFPDRAFTGTVLQLGEELDPTTRTLKVRINLPNTQGGLKPEMFAQVELERTGNHSALFIPESAVEDLNGQKVAFVQTQSDTFQVRTLKLGMAMNGQVEVTDGIKEGERVAIRGAFALKSELLKSTLQGE